MDKYTVAEVSYKNGYAKGYEDGIKQTFDKHDRTRFGRFHSMNIDELAEWLDKYGAFDNSPWMLWFDKKYCKNCPTEDSLIPDSQEEQEYWHHCECSWCELYDKCRYFPELVEEPDNKQIIKMWLESEEEDF